MPEPLWITSNPVADGVIPKLQRAKLTHNQTSDTVSRCRRTGRLLPLRRETACCHRRRPSNRNSSRWSSCCQDSSEVAERFPDDVGCTSKKTHLAFLATAETTLVAGRNSTVSNRPRSPRHPVPAASDLAGRTERE